ncbi:MAG: HupE/UreJ family protein [Acidobacteriota bacterium]|nr:HupE/UreJ family protein [Acidobacteriota bacterium]
MTAPRWLLILLLLAVPMAGDLLAHGVSASDHDLITQGRQLAVFIYLGAKHMVTGYDHLLFLFGVIFFLYRLREVATYVTLFAVGHSVTLLYAVISGTHVNPYLIDAIIGFSVVYKALDNIGAFTRVLSFQPDTRLAVLIFGFFHGLGLGTKLQDFSLSTDGLIPNILAFNVGVELGQLLGLSAILIAMGFWRRSDGFARHAYAANVIVMTCGFILVGYQLAGYAIE